MYLFFLNVNGRSIRTRLRKKLYVVIIDPLRLMLYKHYMGGTSEDIEFKDTRF